MYFAGLADFNEEISQPPSKFNHSTTIFSSTCLLALCSIITTGIAASLLPGNQSHYDASVGVVQGLSLSVSCISFVYIGLYLVAARENEEIGQGRPPIRKLHAACFVAIRIAAILWLGTLIASFVLCFKKGVCMNSSLLCRLQKLDLAVSITAFLSSVLILWSLESCTHPFKTPKSLPIRSKTSYRVSIIDDILERSVSRACKRESCNPVVYEKRRAELEIFEKECNDFLATHPSIRRKASEKSLTCPFKVPGAYPTEKDKRASDSSMSTWSGTSDFSGYSGTTYINPQKPRRARPSSSISSSTRRSPLSTMRYAEFPHIAIEPDLRYTPPPNIPIPPIPPIPPAHKWNLCHPQPQPKHRPNQVPHSNPAQPPSYIGPAPLLPIANPPYNTLDRRPSAMVRPLKVRKASNSEKIDVIPPQKLVRRKTVDIKVPGAFKIEVEFGIEGGDGGEAGFSVEEGEEIPPVLGKKIESFFNRGVVVGVGGSGKEAGTGKTWEV